MCGTCLAHHAAVVSDGPSGSPTAQPVSQEWEEGSLVTLTCELANMDPGNPQCDVFIWDKVMDTTGEPFI